MKQLPVYFYDKQNALTSFLISSVCYWFVCEGVMVCTNPENCMYGLRFCASSPV